MTDAPATTPDKKPAPWRGRRRVMDVKEKFIAVRVTVEDRAKIADAAGEAGLSIGAFLRSLALGQRGRACRETPARRARGAGAAVGRTRQAWQQRQPDCQGVQQHRRGSGPAGIDGDADRHHGDAGGADDGFRREP